MKPSKNIEFELLKTFNRVEHRHWWWEGRRYLLKNLLKNKKPRKILDVGCGTGETLTFLKKIFPQSGLYGIDTSNNAVAYAKKRGHKNVVNANALTLPFKEETFDVVLLLDVLEHIKDDKKVLSEARRVLSKNGTIIITSPGLPILWSDHDKNQGHFRRYTKKDFANLAKKINLKITKISYFNFCLSPIIILIRALGKIPPLRFLVRYDNGINYEVAHHPFLNAILFSIFKSEIWFLIKGVNYPFGVSIVLQLENNE